MHVEKNQNSESPCESSRNSATGGLCSCCVLFLRLLTWKPGWGRPVRYVDPVFHSRGHCVGFIRDPVKAGSVGFVGTAFEHVFLFFVAKKAGAQRFIIDARASNRHFLRPSGPLLTGEGLCHAEFQGALGDAQNWFVGSAGIKNAFHQMRILASGSAGVLGHEVSPASAYCSGTGKRISRIRSVARTVSSRRRIYGRAIESFLAVSIHGALSILDASFKFAGASYLVSLRRAVVNCAHGTKSIRGIPCLFRSDWSLRMLDFRICTDASEKWFAFTVREGCREQASEVGRVSERTRLKRSSRSIRARSRALRVVLEWSSSDEDVISLARVESRADFPEVSLQLLDSSEWRLAACGGFFREENITVLEAPSILYAVWCAESNFPPGRLLILFQNLALVLALCKGRWNKKTLL